MRRGRVRSAGPVPAYAACPACAAERQASLDAQPPTTAAGTNPHARLRRWAHMLGYGGHFLTKARRYSTTFGELRAERIQYRRDHDDRHGEAADDPGHVLAAGMFDDDTPLIVGTLSFAGVGWHTIGDALLANTAAAQARDRQAIGREELAHEAGRTPSPVAQAA